MCDDVKKRDNYVFLIIVILILISVLGLLFLNRTDNNINKVEETKYYLLSDYSRFFTVNSCINKYVNSLNNKNYENILKLLDEDYKKQNSIDINNVSNFIDKLDGNYSFVSKNIYYNKINNQIIIYYVKGYLVSDMLDTINNEKIDKYYIVKFDLKNNLFSIIPDSGSKYMEVSNG